MAFIDEISVLARAGKGGDGTVAWLHLKGKEYSGPAGGNGGDGGNIFVRAVRDLTLLARYRGEKLFAAQDGERGGNREKHGARGKDFILDVPLGSLVRNEETREIFDLATEGQEQLVLKGGRGGAGNAVFKSSVNRSPEESTPGGKGEAAKLTIELRLIADAGFVGVPNAGKTSLLNALANTSGKVGAYAFTTLEPNLGMLFGYVLADIPGLIEGASQGKGLGTRFLRHVSRTRVLVHCLALDSADPLADYRTVRHELEKFEDGALAKKPEIILLTKSDTHSMQEVADTVRSVAQALGKKEEDIWTVSMLEDESVAALGQRLVKSLVEA